MNQQTYHSKGKDIKDFLPGDVITRVEAVQICHEVTVDEDDKLLAERLVTSYEFIGFEFVYKGIYNNCICIVDVRNGAIYNLYFPLWRYNWERYEAIPESKNNSREESVKALIEKGKSEQAERIRQLETATKKVALIKKGVKYCVYLFFVNWLALCLYKAVFINFRVMGIIFISSFAVFLVGIVKLLKN